jgi:prevent-host-death family protein
LEKADYLEIFMRMGEHIGASRLTQRTQYSTFPSEVTTMTTLTASQARAQLYKLLDKAASSHEPIQITGKRANAVLVSEEDWRAIQETLSLLSIPGMRASIRKGLKEPVEKCLPELKW